MLRQAIYFVLSGALNTLATFLLYLALLHVVHYQMAYAISFVAGIFLSYAINTRYVFRTSHSWTKFLAYPLVYLVTYGCGAVVLALSVHQLGIDQRIAPLLATCITLPLSFVLNRLILLPSKRLQR